MIKHDLKMYFFCLYLHFWNSYLNYFLLTLGGAVPHLVSEAGLTAVGNWCSGRSCWLSTTFTIVESESFKSDCQTPFYSSKEQEDNHRVSVNQWRRLACPECFFCSPGQFSLRGAHNLYAGTQARHKSELRNVTCFTTSLCVPQNKTHISSTRSVSPIYK